MPSDGELFDRYLAALGVRARRPEADALSELTAAHLSRVPFENVSKLYFRHDSARRGLSSLAQFVDGIERYRFGGTCYANNVHFNALLAHLGYRVALCGADMSAPNVHIVSVVTLAGRPYLVDVGYAAPLVEPVPLDVDAETEFTRGNLRYVVRPRHDDGRPRVELYRDGVWKHGYSVNFASRRVEDFAAVVAESFSERGVFMHALLVARYGAERFSMVRNLTLVTGDDRAWHASPVTRDQLPDVVEREFGMPSEIVRRALLGVSLGREP